jgi:DDE family transposase
MGGLAKEVAMAIPRAFDVFVEGAPCTVLTRLVAERIIDDQLLRTLFREHAVTQYDRDITITHLVEVMLDVACGMARSVRAGFLRREEEMAASLTAFYRKLDRADPELGMALVAQVAGQLQPLVERLGCFGREPLDGIASYILDGNMLAGTDHRLKPLRKTRAAALPGKSLVLYACASGLVTQTVLWEDAHSQERALLPDLEIPVGGHLIADRNFCVYWFLQHIQQTGSYFTIRHHKQFALPEAAERHVGRCDTGIVHERSWEVSEDGHTRRWRAVRVELDEPTRDGDHEITLITNLPAGFGAQAIAAAYRQRWTIEGHFQRLTEHLHCEIPSLSQPRAALFAFAVSLVAGNLLAVVIAALGSAHGSDLVENLSYYYLVDEIARNNSGMLLALPPRRWAFARRLSIPKLARLLRTIATHANVALLRKSRRGPKKKRRTPNCTNVRHLSTKRVLDKYR